MATIRAYAALNMLNPSIWYGEIVSYSGSHISISDGFNSALYRGSFTYDNFGNVYGTLTGYEQRANGSLTASVSGLNVNANDFMVLVQLGDAEGAYSLALAGADSFTGSAFADVLRGYNGNDTINGAAGNDRLLGGLGNDILIGGSGKDVLNGHGGLDTFKFNKIGDSANTATACDVISGFVRGQDKIDLRSIDAFTGTALNDAFVFKSNFTSSTQGEIRFELFDNAGTSNDYTLVLIDTDADTGSEMMIRLSGLHSLTASDFLL